MKQIVAGVFVATAVAVSVNAETYEWTGAQDQFWTNAANWRVGGEVAANPPGEYLVYDSASSSHFATNGVVSDTAVFGMVTTANTTINLDGQWRIDSVTISKADGVDSMAFVFGTKYGWAQAAEQAQFLKMHGGGTITIDAGVTADQTIQAVSVRKNVSAASQQLTFVNNSQTARLIYKSNCKFNKVGGITLPTEPSPYYYFNGVGTIWQDGPTTYDAVYGIIQNGTGKIIMGETNGGDTGFRIWSVRYPASATAGVREIEIPEGCYLHGVGGGCNDKQIETSVDVHVYGEGWISAQQHYNTTIGWGANFWVDDKKTLDIECGIHPCAAHFVENVGAYGTGTTFINTLDNQCVGNVRLHGDPSILKAKKLGKQSDALGTTSLGTAKSVLFFHNGTLAYGGSGDEETDRTLVSTNTAAKTMTVENQSTNGTLTVKSRCEQPITAAGAVTSLRLKATNNPIIFDGTFQESKQWKILVAGDKGVSFTAVPKVGDAEVPVAIENGGVLEVSDLSVMPTNVTVASGTGSIKTLDGVTYEFDKVPDIPNGSVLNYIIPDGADVTFTGETSRRLINITLNGSSAKLKNGKLTVNADGNIATWIKSGLEEEYTGNWDDANNWKDGGVALDGERAFINTYPDYLTATNLLTIKIDRPVSLKHLRLHDSPKLTKVKITGTGSLTIGAGKDKTATDDFCNYGGIWSQTNSAAKGYGQLHTSAFPDIDVPLTIGSGEAYFNWSSQNGWTLDPNLTPSLHTITKDFSKTDSGWLHFAGQDGWLSFREGAGTYNAKTYIQGYVELYGTNQFSRLGTGNLSLMTWYLEAMEGCSAAKPILLFSFKPGEQYAKITNRLQYDYFTDPNTKGWVGPYYSGFVLQAEEAATSLAVSNRLEFSGQIDGNMGYAAGCAMINSYGKNTSEKQSRYLSPDTSRIIISGESKKMKNNNMTSLRVLGMVEIASSHALGESNSLPLTCGTDGYWVTSQPAGLNGVLVRPGVTYTGAITSQPVINKSGDGYSIAPYMVVGAANAGESEAVFSGDIAEGTQKDYLPSPLRFHAPKGGTARFTGKITTSVATENAATVLAEGDIVLANANNSFARGVKVRSGRLVLADDKAADTKEINLGDIVRTVPGFETVVAMDDGTAVQGSSWKWWSLNEPDGKGGTIWYTGTWLYFTSEHRPESIDGVAIADGQKVLINTPNKYVYNGFYTAFDNSFKRPWAYKQYKDYKNLYGAKFKVERGEKYGGKTFFFAVDVASTKLGDGVMAQELGIADRSLAFHEEPTDADVAVMAEGSRTIANDIKVSNNYSAGKSTIGGVTAGANSTFSGGISLERTVTLEAPANGTVAFTGEFSGDGDVVAEGAGTVDLSATTLSLASTNSIAMAGGTLKLSDEQAANKPLKWVRRVGASADSTGVLSVTGSLNLSNAKFENFTFIDGIDTEHELKIAEATGPITLPAKPINKRWRLIQRENSVYAAAQIPGMILMLK